MAAMAFVELVPGEWVQTFYNTFLDRSSVQKKYYCTLWLQKPRRGPLFAKKRAKIPYF
jgi:hypothetical protein